MGGGGTLDLAVLQVGVNVFDEGVIRIPDRETQLAEGAAADVRAHCLHQQLRGEREVTDDPQPSPVLPTSQPALSLGPRAGRTAACRRVLGTVCPVPTLSSRSLPTFHQFSIHSPPRGLGSQEVCMLSLPGHLPGPLG